MREDLLKTSHDLPLIQMTPICLGKYRWTKLPDYKMEWEEGAKCSDTTLPGFWADELGELAGEWARFCPHPHPGVLWKAGLRYKKKTPKGKKERLPSAVWLMGVRCSTCHACSCGGEEADANQLFASFVLAAESAPFSTAAPHEQPAHAVEDSWGQKGPTSVNVLNHTVSSCSYDSICKHH